MGVWIVCQVYSRQALFSEVCVCGGTEQELLPHIHVPSQACKLRCNVIHTIGDHDHRSYFLQNQEPAIRKARSTVFIGLTPLPARRSRIPDRGPPLRR
jgi:hypothetical protein